MVLNKLKAIAHIVGLLGLLLLAVQGIVSLLGGNPVWAAPLQQNLTVPSVINYQGYLRDAEGSPIDGTYALTLKIYDNPTPGKGAALHTEVFADTTVRNGYFSVLLGDNTPLPANLFSSGCGTDCFIGVEVDNTGEMIPRQRFSTVPYAYQAQDSQNAEEARNANLLDNKDSTFFADTHSLDASDGSPSNALYVNDAGNVGIGTTNPGKKLTVDVGTAFQNGLHLISNLSTGNLIMELEYDDANNRAHYIFDNAGRGHSLTVESKNDLFFSTNGGNERMRIDKQGKITLAGYADPIVIERFLNIGNSVRIPTRFKGDFNCTIGGWSARYDIQEGNTISDYLWTSLEGNLWHIYSNFPDHSGSPENADVDLICFHTNISKFIGERNHFSPD